MRLRAVIIDEPIHVYDEQSCSLWQKALWVKERGYRSAHISEYLPVSTDDFFGTHLIVADELASGRLEPVAMYKSVRKSQSERFHVPFGVLSLLGPTPHKDSDVVSSILSQDSEISYDSAWTINPDYKKDKELSQTLRDFMTMFACNYHLSFGFHRWLSGGVKQFKVGDYFKWLGGQQIIPDFQMSVLDNQTIQLIYISDTRILSAEVLAVKQRMQPVWDNRIIFAPSKSSLLKQVS